MVGDLVWSQPVQCSRTSDNAFNATKRFKFTFSICVREFTDRYSTMHNGIGVTLFLFLGLGAHPVPSYAIHT